MFTLTRIWGLGVASRAEQNALALAIDVEHVDPARLLDLRGRLPTKPHKVVLIYGIVGGDCLGIRSVDQHKLVIAGERGSGNRIVSQLQPAVHTRQPDGRVLSMVAVSSIASAVGVEIQSPRIGYGEVVKHPGLWSDVFAARGPAANSSLWNHA